jgi:YD repeat-containing protein
MNYRSAVRLLLAAAVCACGSDRATSPTPPGAQTVLLKDVVLSSLPSPYYEFAYDEAGRVTRASFASRLRTYDVTYEGDRIAEMRNVSPGGRDRLRYVYAATGDVVAIEYVVNANDSVYTRLVLTFEGRMLTKVERQLRVEGGFIIDKTTSLSYYPDGNLETVTEHRPEIAGLQDETTVVDRFENYDDGINVDAFSLLHSEFFDQLILLPGVVIQHGNPARLTHTGDGLEFTVDYTYAYDAQGRPKSKTGALRITSGSDMGRVITISSEFSYY